MNAAALPMRASDLAIGALIDLYMAHYAGRDTTRAQRLQWWRDQLGAVRLDEVSDDHVHAALEALASQPSRYYAGVDVDGRAIYKAKHQQLASATINRYGAALGAVFTWAIRRRIAPKEFDHPMRRIERRAENNEKTRFLSDDERERLLQACKESKWPRLYLLVMLALSTGARKGELLGLRWKDVDLARRIAHVGRSKNGDPKALPLISVVVEQLQVLGPGATAGLVFPSRLNALRPMAFEARWSQALRVAKVREFRFHDLRHSCASYLAQHGATLLEIGDLLGHRQISMTRRYSHLTASHRSALVERVMGDMR